MAENADLEQVWLVVTHKSAQRNLIRWLSSIANGIWHWIYPKLKPFIEFKLSQPNYTVNTLVHLEEKYPDHEFSMIMGEDNLKSLQMEKLWGSLQNHEIYVYPRVSNEQEFRFKNHQKFIWLMPIVENFFYFYSKNIKEGRTSSHYYLQSLGIHWSQ
jgi:nicotinate-nucleotide adenylyltransferase